MGGIFLRGAFKWSEKFNVRFQNQRPGHSKALSLDGRFDPDDILEKKKKIDTQNLSTTTDRVTALVSHPIFSIPYSNFAENANG